MPVYSSIAGGAVCGITQGMITGQEGIHMEKDEILAKGVNFVYAKEFILKEYGEGVWVRALETLAYTERAFWGGALLIHESYPFSVFKSMVSAISKELGKPKDTEAARVYEYIADRSLNALYKIFFRFANPSFVIKNYPKLWDRFFNTGKVEVPVAEKGHAIVKFVLPEVFLDWLPPACLGYSKKAVEMAGGKKLTLTQTSKTSLPGALWEIVYELKWLE